MKEVIFDLIKIALLLVLLWFVWSDRKQYIKLNERVWTLELKSQEKSKPNENAEIFKNSDNLFTHKKNYE